MCVYEYAYTRMSIRVCAYINTRIRVLGWRVLHVYFGSDISELHCTYTTVLENYTYDKLQSRELYEHVDITRKLWGYQK